MVGTKFTENRKTKDIEEMVAGALSAKFIKDGGDSPKVRDGWRIAALNFRLYFMKLW